MKKLSNSSMTEKRHPVSYRKRYSDLNKAYGGNMKSYYQHYMLNGINEKRNGK
ncbi:hypothetical protein [Ruminococcus sp.]|uniref:hypothetical protein n=1 Tax=Ruminococcus sp. TaxID=41978 RepID=UPI0025DBDD31|nr:hypothetical protein [Ruminococcus sp.]